MAVGISNFPTSLDAASDLVEATNNAFTTINMVGGLSSEATTITVVSTANFPNTGIFRINNEIISYSAKTATTFTVQTRGFESTTAASHANGDQVSLDITASSNNAKNSAIIALETKVGTGSSTPTSNTVLRGTGTGTSAFGQVGLTTDVTGTLPVANGGTGSSSLTANNVLLGNGTSAVQVVAPGTSGNVLTSNGTTWQSVAGTHGILRTSDSPVTLTASSPTNIYLINSSALQVVRLPDATTLTVGRTFVVYCELAVGGTISTATGASLAQIHLNQRLLFTCISTASDLATSWAVTYDNFLLNPAGSENYIINSAFRVDQRQGRTSRVVTTGNFQFVADRWEARALGAGVQASFTDASDAGGIVFTGAANNTGVELRQRIEQSVMNGLQATSNLSTRTVVLSCRLNSSTGNSFSYVLSIPSTADNFTSVTQAGTGTLTGYQAPYRSTSPPIPIFALRGLELVLTTPAIPAGATVTISNVKIEPGSLATPYVSIPYDLELARCQLQLNLLEQSTSPYTFTLNDIGQLVSSTSSSAFTFSIPTNASVPFPVGSQINVVRSGTGTVTIQAASSGTTTINSTGATAIAPILRARYSAATCIKTATDTWLVIGDIA